MAQLVIMLFTLRNQMKRLSQVAKEYHLGIPTVVSYLSARGYKVDSNPNTFLTDDQINALKTRINPVAVVLTEENKFGTISLNAPKINTESKFIMKSPVQKILFGSPGTGKSHRIEAVYCDALGIDIKGESCVKTVFHPEYTYGDFMGKLMPLSDDKGNVSYRYYEGHFLIALSKAYKALNDQANVNTILVIDEINRGNSASIFGSVFQLLDRSESGWSNYAIKLSAMEIDTLTRLVYKDELEGLTQEARLKKINRLVKDTELSFLIRQEIKLPPNLSIIASMNTSDNSIYYMDSAFKRRWDWEFVDVKYGRDTANKSKGNTSHPRKLESTSTDWVEFVDSLNEFLKFNHGQIRKIEDKQIGYYFIKDDIISDEKIKNKLMFFLWDSVFSTDKKPLVKLLRPYDLITFGDFAEQSIAFCKAITEKQWKQNV